MLFLLVVIGSVCILIEFLKDSQESLFLIVVPACSVLLTGCVRERELVYSPVQLFVVATDIRFYEDSLMV